MLKDVITFFDEPIWYQLEEPPCHETYFFELTDHVGLKDQVTSLTVKDEIDVDNCPLAHVHV